MDEELLDQDCRVKQWRVASGAAQGTRDLRGHQPGGDSGANDGADTVECRLRGGDVRRRVHGVCSAQVDVRKAAGELLELLLLGREGEGDCHVE